MRTSPLFRTGSKQPFHAIVLGNLKRLSVRQVSAFSDVICGLPHTPADDCDRVIEGVKKNIDYYFDYSVRNLKNASDDISFFGPYANRVLIELCCTAILGRFDPIRLLVLGRIQGSGTFRHELRSGSAIQWSGDVMSPKDEKEEAKLWDQSRKTEDFGRALLSQHLDGVIWRPAFNKCLDAFAEVSDGEIVNALKQLTNETFIPSIRGRLSQLYSTLSKGVHGEVLLPTATANDKESVRQWTRDGIGLLLQLATVSHFGPTAAVRLTSKQLTERLVTVETEMNAV